jgi:hypothetical protein
MTYKFKFTFLFAFVATFLHFSVTLLGLPHSLQRHVSSSCSKTAYCAESNLGWHKFTEQNILAWLLKAKIVEQGTRKGIPAGVLSHQGSFTTPMLNYPNT